MAKTTVIPKYICMSWVVTHDMHAAYCNSNKTQNTKEIFAVRNPGQKHLTGGQFHLPFPMYLALLKAWTRKTVQTETAKTLSTTSTVCKLVSKSYLMTI